MTDCFVVSQLFSVVRQEAGCKPALVYVRLSIIPLVIIYVTNIHTYICVCVCVCVCRILNF